MGRYLTVLAAALPLAILLSGCQAIGEIFRAGFLAGLIIVLLVLALILWLVFSRSTSRPQLGRQTFDA